MGTFYRGMKGSNKCSARNPLRYSLDTERMLGVADVAKLLDMTANPMAGRGDIGNYCPTRHFG